MKKILILIILLSTFFSALSQEYIPRNGIKDVNKTPVFFTNAIVHIDAETTLNNCDVLFQGGKIKAVGTNLIAPKNAIVKNLTGKHLYASFIDLYSSFGIPSQKKKSRAKSPQYETSTKGPYYWNEAIKSEYNALSDFTFDEKSKKELLKKGFGVVLSHRENGLARGSGFVTSLNSSANKSLLSNESAYFYSFKKGNSNQVYPSSLMGCIALLRQFNYDANWYKENQPPFKDYSLEVYLNSLKKPQFFITNNNLDLLRASKIANEFNLNYIIKGGGDEYERINEIKNSGHTLLIPLSFPKAYDVEDPYDASKISTRKLRHWRYAPYNLSVIERNQINCAITSNGLNAKDFIKNIRLAVSKGFSKEKAYKALTEIPASILNMNESLGKIEKGKWANFIICSDEFFENKGIILENWVQGNQTILSRSNELDIRGNYNLNTNQNIRTLVVEGDKTKPKASLQYNLITDSVANGDLILDKITGKPIKVTKKQTIAVSLKIEENKINLSYQLNKGAFILSGVVNYDSGSWDGNGQNPNGEWLKWTAIRKDKFKVEKKKNTFLIDSTTYTPLYPSSSFGFDTLPISQSFLIKNTTVWTSEIDGVLYNTDVLINNGTIKYIGNVLDVVDQSTITIDGTGKHLTAGLIDEHSHIAISRGVNEGSHSVTAEVRLLDVINPNDVNIYRQIAGGVTSSQLLHGSANPVGGQSALIKLRWGSTAEEMKFENAPGFIKFALGENVKQSNWGDRNTIRFPQSRMGVEQVYYDAFTRAKEYGDNWNKYYTTKRKGKYLLDKPRRDLQLETLLEILNSQRFITCHSYVQSEINMLIKVADSMGFTLNTFTHILEGYKVADKMKKHGAGGSTFSDWWAYKYEVKEAIPHNASLLNAMGITVAINSDDAEMGRRLNQEAAKGIKYGGMSEEDALNMVTINPAKLLHINDRVGSIKIGKDADVVLWTGNPLSIYSKVDKTFIDGKLYFDINKQSVKEMALRKERASIISKMIAFKNSGGKVQKVKSTNETLHNCSLIKDDGN
jgi:imidazolonepropionase-like amidohydrolase